MDVKDIIDNLNLISNVIPDYTSGRSRGLNDDEVEVLAREAVTQAIDLLEKLEEENQWLYEENQWLYGKLNMISDIVERGRTEARRL